MKRREGEYGLGCWDFGDEGNGDFQGRGSRKMGKVDGVVRGMGDRMGVVGNDKSLDVGDRVGIDEGVVVRTGEVVVVVAVEVGGTGIEAAGRRSCCRREQSLDTW